MKKKAILIGDFSAFHYNLYLANKQLQDPPLDLDIYDFNDGWKKIGSSGNASILRTNRYLKWLRKLTFIFFLEKYDVVQFISPNYLQNLSFFRPFLLKRLARNNHRIIYVIAGDDPVVWQFGLLNLRYNWAYRYGLDGADTSYLYGRQNSSKIISEIRKYEIMCIATAYDYFIGYEKAGVLNNLRRITLSYYNVLNDENFKRSDLRKIKIMHGIIRPFFKGSDIIQAALKEIVEKYSDLVDVEIVDRMPYKEYVSNLKNVDILVDQLFSYSYGMNAVIGMSYGCAVISGAETEACEFMSVDYIPVVNCRPSKSMLVSILENLITDREYLKKVQADSRLFFHKHHDSKGVLKDLIDTWEI